MSRPNPPLPPDVQAALQAGKLIEAIKLLRTHAKLGLKESKDLIDAHRLGNGLPEVHPGLSPGEVPRSGPFARTVMVALVVAVLAYVLLYR